MMSYLLMLHEFHDCVTNYPLLAWQLYLQKRGNMRIGTFYWGQMGGSIKNSGAWTPRTTSLPLRMGIHGGRLVVLLGATIEEGILFPLPIFPLFNNPSSYFVHKILCLWRENSLFVQNYFTLGWCLDFTLIFLYQTLSYFVMIFLIQ